MRGDAPLAYKIGWGIGQATDNFHKEVADLLSYMLTLVGILQTYFLARSINNWCKIVVNNLLDSIECFEHEGISIVNDALHVNFDGTGAFGLQELFQLLSGLLDM